MGDAAVLYLVIPCFNEEKALEELSYIKEHRPFLRGLIPRLGFSSA